MVLPKTTVIMRCATETTDRPQSRIGYRDFFADPVVASLSTAVIVTVCSLLRALPCYPVRVREALTHVLRVPADGFATQSKPFSTQGTT
jgi:hypothetical protein